MEHYTAKCILAIAKLNLPNTPNFTDMELLQEYCELLSNKTIDECRDIYRKVRNECRFFPTYAELRELAGYKTEADSKKIVCIEIERRLLSGYKLSPVSQYYFDKAGGLKAFRHFDMSNAYTATRIKDIVDSVWEASGPEFPRSGQQTLPARETPMSDSENATEAKVEPIPWQVQVNPMDGRKLTDDERKELMQKLKAQVDTLVSARKKC